MSGIAGIYHAEREHLVDPNDLRRMVDIIAHRGPDGVNCWCEDNVGLGHRMLWSTPESLFETMPLVKGNLAITADARIDNRDELLDSLYFSDRSAEKVADSEIILAAYERWGEQCLDKLLGAFAFAIWDGREEKLFCARDRFGIKPFYYYASKQRFICATEVKAILCLSYVPQQINEARIGDYLSSNSEDRSDTFYQDIFRLPPAHCLTVSPKGVNAHAYWSLDIAKELRLRSDEAYAEAFLYIFKQATACRMRSASPIGSMLSGGMDSSSITCMARHLLKKDSQPLSTFSATFDDVKESDEQPYIQSVLDSGNFKSNFIQGDRIGPLADYQKMQWHQDEPCSAFNLFINWNAYRVAKSQNIRVILDGFDGDSTVSHGTGYIHDLARSGRWLVLSREIRGLSTNFKDSYNATPFSFLKKYNPLLKLAHRAYGAARRRVISEEATHFDCYQPQLNQDFVQRMSLKERHKQLVRKWHSLDIYPVYKQEHYYSLLRGVMPHTLEKLNHAATPFSVEPRFPFWDQRLIEFCLSLPPEQRIKHGLTRMVLRRGMNNILPGKIQWRGDKSNLGINFDRAFLKYEREHIKAMLNKHRDVISDYMNLSVLESAYDRYVGGVPEDNDIINLWKAVTLVLWLRQEEICEVDG